MRARDRSFSARSNFWMNCRVTLKATRKGATEAELQEKAAEMANFKEMYKNPLFVVVVTFLEVFPVGLIVALVSALILKRKPATTLAN